MYDPAIKLLLRYRKKFLLVKAKELDLDTEGTKLELAVRIAKIEEEMYSRAWQSISGG